MGFFDSALSAMGQSLAQSASGYIQGQTGPVVGNMIGSLFGGGQATGGADLAQLQTAIQTDNNLTTSQLTLLNGQMTTQTMDIENIGSQLTALSSAVAVLEGEVGAMVTILNQIAQDELFQAWQSVDNQMTDAITNIHSDYSVLAGFTANYTNTSTLDQVQPVMAALQLNGPLNSMSLINTYILGGGGQSQGALQLWSAMVTPLVQKGLMDYREAVDQYTAYYKKLVGAQLLAANMLVEVSNFYAPNGKNGGAAGNWNTYKGYLLAQEPEFIQWLVPLVYSGVMAYGAFPQDQGPAFTFYEGAMQLHPGLQAMPGDVGGQGYYAPTSIFEDAEAMLSTLSVTDPSDRRIVVHMVFCDDQQGTFKTPIDANPLTITQGSTNISPTSVNKFIYQGFPVWNGGGTPDWNFFNGYGGGYMYLYRQVYTQDASHPTALPDGLYQLSDLNGNLPALETYFNVNISGSTTSFQETKVLNHQLSVSPTSQFDFMNFAAYMAATVGSPDSD